MEALSLLYTAKIIAAQESYIGLVESAVGLIPAAGGCTELAFNAFANNQANIKDYYNISMAKISNNAHHARQMPTLKMAIL